MPDESGYANIRELLGNVIGRTVVDVTQHDQDEFLETRQAYVQILFDNGDDLKFIVGEDGFFYNRGDSDNDTTPT